MPVTTVFCPVPILLKRPRPPSPKSLPPSTLRCNLQPSDPALAKKVESYLLQSEQQPDIPPDVRLPPRVLPVSLDLLNYHARVASRKSDGYDLAQRIYRRCISAAPSDGRAWLGLARLQSANGDVTAARRTFRNAVNAVPRNPFILQGWGVFEERLSNLERAKGLYLAALRADPSHAPAWVALGLWHQRHENNVSSARVAFRRGAEADPSNYYVWHVWGVLEKSCQRYPRARDCFRKGIEANPENAATYVLWGSLEDELGNSQLAMELFSKAHKVNRFNIHAYVSHAVAAEKSGHLKRARKLLNRAISLRPNDPSPRQALALLEFRQGDTESARAIFEAAIQKNPSHTPTWHAWARVECSVSNYDRARKLFQEAVWAGPRSPHVVRTWHSWAMMEMNLGRNDVARRYFAHGLEVDKRSVVLLSGAAELEAREGNMSRARECMEQCIQLEPWRQSTWRLYRQLEAMYGSTARVQLVYERSVVINQQVEERFKLSDPLPGDFQGSGMWIDALELPPDRSAFDSVGTRHSEERPTRRISISKRNYGKTHRNQPRSLSENGRSTRKRSGSNTRSLTSTPNPARTPTLKKNSGTPPNVTTAFGF